MTDAPMTPGGPLDGWETCEEPGCPSWDDVSPEEEDAFTDTHDAHGVMHFHIGDSFLVRAS